MSQLFISGDQGTGASASASVLPINILDWFDLLAVQGTLKSLLQHHHPALFLEASQFGAKKRGIAFSPLASYLHIPHIIHVAGGLSLFRFLS